MQQVEQFQKISGLSTNECMRLGISIGVGTVFLYFTGFFSGIFTASSGFLPVIFSFLCSSIGFFGLATLFAPGLIHVCLVPQDLKEKYSAEWAIVTGGSSGIGKSMVDILCQQGINVIIVAIPEKLLDDTCAEMSQKYPAVTVKKVGADLSQFNGSGRSGFMDAIEDAIPSGQSVQLLFCNAGFMIGGFFAHTPLGKNKANANVNVNSHLELTYEFINKMLRSNANSNGKRGAVFFTSSPAWMLPSPTAAMYAGTKAFITHFGVSLAAEVKSEGIDVCIGHPSPVQSRFYDAAYEDVKADTIAKFKEMLFFKSTAQTPDVFVNTMFACVGRLILCNQGYFPKVMGVMHKLLDFSMLAEITANVAHTQGSFLAAKEAVAAQQKQK